MDLSFLGAVAAAIPAVTGQLNKGYQANQLSIAEANARAAEAQAVATAAEPKSQTSIAAWVMGGVAVTLIIIFLLRKK